MYMYIAAVPFPLSLYLIVSDQSCFPCPTMAVCNYYTIPNIYMQGGVGNKPSSKYFIWQFADKRRLVGINLVITPKERHLTNDAHTFGGNKTPI